jgi:hypothetical protein
LPVAEAVRKRLKITPEEVAEAQPTAVRTPARVILVQPVKQETTLAKTPL